MFKLLLLFNLININLFNCLNFLKNIFKFKNTFTY